MRPDGSDPGAGLPPIEGTEAVFARLPREGVRFSLEPDGAAMERLAAELELLGLRKLRFDGRIRPEGKSDWRLDAHLGATVVQPCAVTLVPVTTRLEETVTRRYLARWDAPEPGSEVEMPEDDTAEPLPRAVDLVELMHEALALALPDYPRAAGADFRDIAVTEPGAEPMTDEAARPFAGLAGLRDRLTGGDDPDKDG